MGWDGGGQLSATSDQTAVLNPSGFLAGWLFWGFFPAVSLQPVEVKDVSRCKADFPLVLLAVVLVLI